MPKVVMIVYIFIFIFFFFYVYYLIYFWIILTISLSFFLSNKATSSIFLDGLHNLVGVGKGINPGSTISVELDLRSMYSEKRTIHFIFDNEQQEFYFCGLPGDVMVAVWIFPQITNYLFIYLFFLFFFLTYLMGK